MGAVEPSAPPASRQVAEPELPRHWRVVAVVVLRWGLVLAALWLLARLLGRVDWEQVGEAVVRLRPWQVALLVALVAVRTVGGAVPLAVFVPGLGLPRAVTNDLTANVVSTAVPPPSDAVVRLAMFRSWRIPVALGVSGLVLNSLAFYTARFAAPTIGFLLLLVVQGYDATFAWAAVSAGCVVLVIAVALSLRFVGVPASQAAFLVIVASFLCVYPLTALPFSGLGALDAALIALLTAEGVEGEAELVAGVVVWRCATLLLPLAVGTGAFLVWRRPRRAPPDETDA